MAANVAHNAFELVRHIHYFADFIIGSDKICHLLTLLHCLGKGHPYLKRNQLREFVGEAVRLSLHTSNVAHHGFRRHGAEGDDLADRLHPIHVANMLNHPIPPFHTEIYIKVWHRYPLGIQEALEQQVILQRIEVGNPQRVGDQRTTARTATGAHRNVVLLSPGDKFHHNQKVTGEAHLVYDIEFKLQALVIVGLCPFVGGPASGYTIGQTARGQL